MDESTNDATPEKAIDEARPDQLESEMYFGETIAWMRPNSPLFKPEPEPEPESLPVAASTAAAATGLDQFGPPPSATPMDEEEGGGSSRRRTLLIAAGVVVALVIAGGVAFALTSGGGDDAKVATGAVVTTTTVAPTTTTAPAPTIPPSEGTEKTTAAGTSVTVNADVLFDVNSAELTPEASSRLGAFLTLAARDKKRHLLIEGFTDSDGDAAFNQQLSEARAQSVATWLIGQGIDPARISAVGHGAEQPVAANDTPENKALNRRVVVTLQTASQ